MARYAPVGPLAILRRLHSKALLDNYVMFIAPDILKHPFEYAQLSSAIRKKHKKALYSNTVEVPELKIIVDNGVIESSNGEPLPIRELIGAALVVGANVLVLPDKLGQRATTIQAAQEALVILRDFPITPMFVVQGGSHKDIKECITGYRQLSGWSDCMWGVPRWIANKLGSRIPTLRTLAASNSKLPFRAQEIHLLGMSYNLLDDLACCRMPGVVGIDSANPLIMGIHNVTSFAIEQYQHFSRGNYWEMEQDAVTWAMQYNVGALRDAIQ